MTRYDYNQTFWKEKFISGLPSVFAKKIKIRLRKQNNNKISYDKLTYGDLINVINTKGLNLCNDLKMNQ